MGRPWGVLGVLGATLGRLWAGLGSDPVLEMVLKQLFVIDFKNAAFSLLGRLWRGRRYPWSDLGASLGRPWWSLVRFWAKEAARSDELRRAPRI